MPSLKTDFGALNYIGLVLYLAAVLGVGVYWTKFNKNTDEYFRGGQGVPWWAAGVSIFATILSSITYMSMPALSYSGDWVISMANLPIVLLAPVIIAFFLPIYRRIDATSAYEYLEKRFNYPVRLFGAISFSLLHIGRIAVVLYLPALALATVTDLNIYTSITVMGVLSVVYAVMGGIQAVIWTDVLQTVVLMGGALLCFVMALLHIDGGIGAAIQLAAAHHKFHFANLSGGATTSALWVVLLGNLFGQLIPFSSDQAYVQRYMTTPTERQAAKAIWVNASLAMPATFLFLSLGTAMWVFYQQHPARLGALPTPDAIFPWFIAHELPPGVGGIVVAGIFAAAQSTISTSMNSLATVMTVDVFHRLRGKGTDAQDLRLARILTVVFGTIGVGAAFLLALANLKSMFDTFLAILGLTGSALAGLFLLGIFTRRTNVAGAATGAGAAIVMLFCVKEFTAMSFFLYAAVGVVTCVVVGYLASLVTGGEQRPLAGLTYHTLRGEAAAIRLARGGERPPAGAPAP